MARISLLLIAAVVAGVAAADPPGRITPRTVERPIADALADAVTAVRNQSGLPVEIAADLGKTPCPAAFPAVPAWDALMRIAATTDTRIMLGDHGRRITLAKRPGPAEPASVDGPFRVAVRQIRGVADFDTGRAFTELALELHWEPRLAVFRVDAIPTISTVTDDRGSGIVAESSRAKTPTTGAAFASVVRL
ncbi:MAG: hypothetical protein ACRC7O_04650, partial [Fimbriiglobus sp.]